MSRAKTLGVFTGFQRRFDRNAAFRRFQRYRLSFLKDLAATLKAGAQLSSAIIESAQRCEDPLQAMVYQDIRERLSNGEKLSTAMGSWFAESERMLLEAFLEGARTNEGVGEALGNMVQVIEPYEQLQNARRSLAFSAFIRALVSALAFVITGAALMEFKNAMPVDRWPEWIRPLPIFFGFLREWWIPIAAILGALPFTLIYVLNNWRGPDRRRLDRKTPGLRIYREVHGSLLMIALGAYTAAGRGIGESCRKLSMTATPWLRSYLGLIQHRAQKEKGAEIVDVGLFEWRQMVRLVCLSAGVGLPMALRKVGLESSDIVAAQLMQRLAATDKALNVAQKAVVFSCTSVILTLYFAMIGMAVSASR
jgi:hypothetical protein